MDTAPPARQQRGLQQRSAILDAAVAIIVRDQMRHVTHRHVAETAGVSLGAIRYYFSSREELLLAALDHLEQRRLGAAEVVIDAAAPAMSMAEFAVAALSVYAGPDIDDEALAKTIGWVVDSSREATSLAGAMSRYRKAANADLLRLFEASGRGPLDPVLLADLIDGAMLSSSIEHSSGHRDRIVAAIVRLMVLLQPGTPGPVRP